MFITAFNVESPAHAGVILPDQIEYPDADWKYANIEFVYERVPESIKRILEQAPVVGGYKNTLVDIKVQNLVPKKTSCIAGWHLDGPENPLHPSTPEKHHLFIHGGGPTEFIDQCLLFRVAENTSQKELIGQIPNSVAV